MSKIKKILFYGANKNSPAYNFYFESFSKIENYEIDTDFDYKKINNDFYKFIFLHTGYKKKIDLNLIKTNSKMILVEPRSGHFNDIKSFDFLIVNSFETKLFYSKFNIPSLIYPPIHEYNIKQQIEDDNSIRLIYHGNSKHLKYFKDKLQFILNNIITKKKIELHLIYDLKLKKVNFFETFKNKNIEVFHYKHSHEIIKKVLSKKGIGLVPQLIPEKRSILQYFTFINFIKLFSEKKSEYILRFKENSNLGRHLVFAQFKMPFVTEPTISSTLFLGENCKSLISYSKYDWLKSVQFLIDNTSKAEDYGNYIYDKWKKNFSHQVLNSKFIEKIEQLYENS